MRAKRAEVVLITGASAGLGRAIAREFAKRCAYIGLLARDSARLERARAEVESLGGQALVLPVDVCNPEEVEAAAKETEQKFGPIDVWVNNAMTSVFSPFKDMTAEEFRRVTDVTYLGYVYGTLSALKRMIPRDRGTIVQVGSSLAYRGIPLQSAYCGAKHAIEGFSESVRTELMHDHSKVHITLVHMPALNTPQFSWVKSRMPKKPQPVPPIYQPEVAARAVYWAAHHRRRDLHVGISTDMVIYGNKLFPALGDHYLAKTGFRSQQTDQPEDPNRSDNLWQTVPGGFGAHGDFDDRSQDHSLHLWLKTHRGTVALAAVCLLAGLYMGVRHRL